MYKNMNAGENSICTLWNLHPSAVLKNINLKVDPQRGSGSSTAHKSTRIIFSAWNTPADYP